MVQDRRGLVLSWAFWGWAGLGCLLLAAAFPPINLSWLAWVAPCPWLVVIERTGFSETPRASLKLWIVSFLMWLWLLQGIRLAHPALYAGWLALSAYVAVYLPLFVGLTRLARQRFHWPLVIAAPVIWTGLELTRAYLLTGFAIGLLAHTQTSSLHLLQIASLGGSYLVGLVMVTVAVGLFELWQFVQGWRSSLSISAAAKPTSPNNLRLRPSLLSLGWAGLLFSTTMMYGYIALQPGAETDHESQPPLKVVLIQGSLDTKFEYSPTRAQETLQHYLGLIDQACERYPRFDLLVLPESSCPIPHFRIDKQNRPPPESKISVEDFQGKLAQYNEQFLLLLSRISERINQSPQTTQQAAFILNCTSLSYDNSSGKTFNTGMLVDPQGNIAGTYDKMHPVMFGEYIPLADMLPILYRITPMPGGLTAGTAPTLFRVNDYSLTPNICFESTVPHLLRRQLVQLRAQNSEPDFLVNVTNDGWFWGSAILDLHFRCAVLRAVELRKPIVVAANTGLSTAIDGNGRVLVLGDRRQPQVLFAELKRDGRTSIYSVWGDWPLGICAVLVWLLMVVGAREWWQTTKKNAK